MEPEMKSLLTLLLGKVERIEANMATKDDVARLENEQHQLKDEMRQFKDEMHQFKDGMHQFKDEMHQMKDEMHQMKDEQRQMKEMLSFVRLKEIGRLDGRIDQLAQDVALGRNPNAA